MTWNAWGTGIGAATRADADGTAVRYDDLVALAILQAAAAEQRNDHTEGEPGSSHTVV